MTVYKEVGRSLRAGSLLVVLVVLLLYVFISRVMPPLQHDAVAAFKRFPPRSIPHLVAQRDALLRYAIDQPATVLIGWAGAYILMQTFAVPGTLTLSLLAGAMFGVRRGLAMVAAVSTLGSCSCYCLSWAIGAPLVKAMWPERTERFRAEVQRRRADLFNFIIFLRVTPLLPNTFVNVASPLAGVPMLPFALGTLLGCMPNNALAVHAGSQLGELQSLSDLADAKMVCLSLATGCLALVPVWLKRRRVRSEAEKGQ